MDKYSLQVGNLGGDSDELVEGVFRFTPKTDLKDEYKITLLARAYADEFFCNHTLQEYIQSLISAATDAQAQFEKGVKMLMVEDYAYIQDSILQDQQQPLGDYLAWLYGSYWTHLLVTNQPLKEKQERIDKIISTKRPLHHTLPSTELGDIFMAALFESDLDEIKHHPWEGIEETVASLPYLHLGDLFTAAGNKSVYMILNPQCDLERPDCKSKDLSVILLLGKLELLESGLQKGIKTDFFVFEGQSYRIVWNLKEFTTVPLFKFEEWMKEKGYERKYRLKEPFVLDIQQQFSSNISRVGLPVSPPLSSNISLRVRYKRYDNTVHDDFVPRSDKFAFLPITRKKENVRLTLGFALEFKSALVKEVDLLNKALAAETDHKIIKEIKGSLEIIEGFLAGYDDWFFEHRFFAYPETNKIKIFRNKVLCITMDSVKEYLAQVPFLIDVITLTPTAIEIEPDQDQETVASLVEVNPISGATKAVEEDNQAASAEVIEGDLTSNLKEQKKDENVELVPPVESKSDTAIQEKIVPESLDSPDKVKDEVSGKA